MATIICFSTVDWEHLWYHPQALMARFGKNDDQVIFVETIGLRSPKLKDFRRIFLRLKKVFRQKNLKNQPPKGIKIFSPLVLPFLDSRWACYLNVRWLVYKLKKLIKPVDSEEIVIWVYLPTWTVSECVKRIPHRVLVYNSIDALDAAPEGVSRNYAMAEADILKQADLVLTTSETLYHDKAPFNKNTHWVPPGVDESWFEKTNIADEVDRLLPPRVGFFGAIDHRLDLDLIMALAQKHNDWSFVFIGAVRCDVSALEEMDNVYFLGPKPHALLNQYVAGLDAVFLPYVIDDFTQSIQPAKLYECLALGKPVVVTPLPSLKSLDRVVALAEGAEEFDRALRTVIFEDRPDLKKQRREMARHNSWERRFQEIVTLLKDVMS